MRYKFGNKPLRFVIKLHHANELHFDLRFELNGFAVSFYFYESPFFEPNKSIEIYITKVHSVSGMMFEGVLPEGMPGAGPAIVWDIGIYYPENIKYENLIEKQIEEDLRNGKFTFILKGEKIYAKFKLKEVSKEKRLWLLKKEENIITSKKLRVDNKSVISNKTLDEIEAQNKYKSKSNNPNQLPLNF